MKRWVEAAFYVPEIREEASAWAVSKGLNPKDIPIAGLLREGPSGWIEVECFKFDEAGAILWDHDAADGEGRPLSEWIVVQGPIPAHLVEDVEL